MPPLEPLAIRIAQAADRQDWDALFRLDADVARLLAARPRLAGADRDMLSAAYRRALDACREARDALDARLAELPAQREAQHAYSLLSDWSQP